MKTLSRFAPCSLVLRCALLFALLFSTMACSPSLSKEEEADAAMASTRWLGERYGVVHDRELNQLLRRVSKRLGSTLYDQALERTLSESAVDEYSDIRWQVVVIKASEPNAFSLGSGVIVVTLGMLHELRSEAQLAAIISHEMAHQLLGHTQQAIAESVANASTPVSNFSLDDELAADELGLKVLGIARYDLRHASEALSIGYRPRAGKVTGPPPAWLTQRMARLGQNIDRNIGQLLPATQNSREFTRVWRNLPG